MNEWKKRLNGVAMIVDPFLDSVHEWIEFKGRFKLDLMQSMLRFTGWLLFRFFRHCFYSLPLSLSVDVYVCICVCLYVCMFSDVCFYVWDSEPRGVLKTKKWMKNLPKFWKRCNRHTHIHIYKQTESNVSLPYSLIAVFFSLLLLQSPIHGKKSTIFWTSLYAQHWSLEQDLNAN